MAPALVGHHWSLLSRDRMTSDAAARALAALVGVPFTKMTGSGNDFVVFDGRDVAPELLTKPEVIQAICSRTNGVGADGIVILEPHAERSAAGFASPEKASVSPGSREFSALPIRLRYFNRDGTLGELCGNATLCSTNFAILAGLCPPTHVLLETDAGRVRARLADGVPEIDIAPVDRVLDELPSIARIAKEQRIGFALVGVPHVVILTTALDEVDVAERGRSIRQHPSLQPAGANVNWVAKVPGGQWAYRTYERGVEDETLACGTGAIAAAILLTSWGLASGPVELITRSGRPVLVNVDDNPDRVRQHPSKEVEGDRRCYPSLRGEGRVVFRGRIEALG